MHPAEVVPVALGVRFVVRALLIPFAALAGYFVAWGFVFVMDAVTRAFFGTLHGAVSWVPFVGRVVSQPILIVQHKLSSFLGGMEQQMEHQMAARWHALASLVSALAADTKAAAIFDYQLAHKLATVYGLLAEGKPGAAWRALIKSQQAQTKAAQRAAVQATKAAHAAQAAGAVGVATPHAPSGTITRTYPTGKIGTHVRALEAEVGHVVEWDIPRLRARSRAIEHALHRLFKWTRTHPLVIPEAIAIAAVAHALGKLGGSWIRCRNWNRIGRSVCGLPLHLIEEIFGGAIVTFAVLDICDFAMAAQAVAQEFVPELMALVDVENALIGCHGATAAPPLTLPALHLPPTNLGLPLAA